jgi:hypothetical protein
MADPKQQIISQIQQQAALSNARALVEVRFPSSPTELILSLTHASSLLVEVK